MASALAHARPLSDRKRREDATAIATAAVNSRRSLGESYKCILQTLIKTALGEMGLEELQVGGCQALPTATPSGLLGLACISCTAQRQQARPQKKLRRMNCGEPLILATSNTNSINSRAKSYIGLLTGRILPTRNMCLESYNANKQLISFLVDCKISRYTCLKAVDNISSSKHAQLCNLVAGTAAQARTKKLAPSREPHKNEWPTEAASIHTNN